MNNNTDEIIFISDLWSSVNVFEPIRCLLVSCSKAAVCGRVDDDQMVLQVHKHAQC